MQRPILAALTAATLLLASPFALAQTDPAPASYTEMSIKERTEALLSYFIDGTKTAMEAEALAMNAVGMKAEADVARAQAATFVHEATTGQMEEVILLRSNSSAALAKKLAAGGMTLADAQKAQLVAGIAGMAQSVKHFGELMTEFPELKKALRDAGLKRKKALYASRFLPQALADSKQSLGAAVAFARANNIAVSAEAAELAK